MEHMAPAPAPPGALKEEHKVAAAASSTAPVMKALPAQAADKAASAKTVAANQPVESTSPAAAPIEPISIENPAAAAASPDAPAHEPSTEIPSKQAELASAAPVTVTGCVAREGESFWLTNTSGAGVPSTRSWKSGFLKKHTASLELVHTASALKLGNYVGQRVSATGALKDRELQLRSLQRVAASCS